MTSNGSDMEFVDERGLRWNMAEFCRHYRLDADRAMSLFGEMDWPTTLDTRGFAQCCKPNAKILRGIIVTLPGDQGKRIYPSVDAVAKFAEEFAEKNLPACRRRKRRSYQAAWKRLGRSSAIDLEEMLEEAVAPKMQRYLEKNEVVRVEKKLTGIQAKLAAIPGPTRYERRYFDDAGDFGAQTIQRSNFAGRTKGGGPIYTWR